MYTLTVEARNLASPDSTGREEIIKAVRERHHRLSENRKQGSNSEHALHAGDGTGGGHGKGGGHGNGKSGLGESTDEAVEAPTRTVVARPRLPRR